MLKNILNLKGSKPLSKLQQTKIMGGGDFLSHCIRRIVPCSNFDDDLKEWIVDSFGNFTGCCSLNNSSS